MRFEQFGKEIDEILTPAEHLPFVCRVATLTLNAPILTHSVQ